MKACASESTSWTFTPTNTIRSALRRAASCSTGASSAHGPHHDAQKFSTTGLPLAKVSESLKVEPSNKPREKSGAFVNGTLTTLLPATSFCCRPNHSRNSKPTTTAAAAAVGRAPGGPQRPVLPGCHGRHGGSVAACISNDQRGDVRLAGDGRQWHGGGTDQSARA